MRVRLPNGKVIHGHSRGEARLLYNEVFNEQVYLRNGVELRDGDVVFDVGANIGLFSLFVGEILPNATIYAFEPVPDIYEYLRRNTRCIEEKAKLRNVGLSDRESREIFTFYPHLPCFSTSCPSRLERRWDDLRDMLDRMSAPRPGRARPIREKLRSWGVKGLLYYASRKRDRLCTLTRLSKVVEEQGIERIDLLKIDVEGAEWDVLRGIDEEHWRKIRQLVIEVHDVQPGADGMADWLGDRGYDVAVDRADENRRSPVALLYALRRRGVDPSEHRSRDLARSGGPAVV
jgi:hypothetical protein